MFGEEKNLTDSSANLGITIKDSRTSISYTKTNKLITALYMVTDIIDKDEPLRNKLRTLGTNIISDINTNPVCACDKISEIMSFLDIASAINIISEMNCNILRKEFLELDQSIKQSTDKVEVLNRQINLSEFFKGELPARNTFSQPVQFKGHDKSLPERPFSRAGIGHKGHTRLGVQKGSTLLKALSDTKLSPLRAGDFDILKKHRREDIINIIKLTGGSATIKDIKDKVQSVPNQAGSLVSCGEKTLQRELVSMVHDGVLNKTGEKRWSRYFLK
ncbi:MAG: hypothetical protein WCT44_01255 [Candidatus Paceibacterota bacterium]